MTPDQAVSGVKDGMTIMVGGFLGTGCDLIIPPDIIKLKVTE